MTWVEVTGSIGFLCYFLYDINSVTKKKKLFQSFFLLGTILVLIATAGMIARDWKGIGENILRTGISAVLAVLAAGLLIYTLFFALPFQETYVEENHERKTYREGVYALCRHPGVLWFAFFYFAIALLLGTWRALADGCLLTAWNLGYIVLQDRMIFPKTFSDYKDYQKTTPFLVPNRSSIKRCMGFWERSKKQ